MLVDLRSGGRGRPLFVFPGLGGHARELSALSSKIGGQRPIIAVEAFATSTDGFAPTTVESMAALAVQYIKARQSEGPYRLLGYSFGGLVALEVASRLRSAGESVVYLGLIDTYYDHRYWPTRTFVAAQFRRAWFHLSAIAKKSLPQAISEIGVRAGRLVGRLGQRAATQASDHPSEKPQDRQEVCALAMAKYQPKMVSGKVTLYRSKGGADFGCDPAKILSPYILDLDIRSIDSDHMRLVRDDRALDDLSRSLTRDIAASGSAARTRACRVLMVTSFNWFNATRLGHALHVAGFDVQVLCPPRHTLAQVGFIDRVYPYRPLALRACLLAAIEAADPYLVIPCDDHMAASLHQLFDELVSTDQASSRLRALISRSLGAPENLSLLHRRAVIMDVAAQEGLRHPPTVAITRLSDLIAWSQVEGYPAVLKTDRSWGGDGVTVFHDQRGAARAFAKLSARPSLAKVAKRLFIDGDVTPLLTRFTSEDPQLSVQTFVQGPAGNAAVVCLEGKVLAAVYVEVVHSGQVNGPATVVRVIDHPEMDYSVRAMVKRLGLSGLCGFDFILSPDDGGACLIELNPRATPTCHLRNAEGQDLLSVLAAKLSRRSTPRPHTDSGERVVALFPQELQRDPQSPYLESQGHDVPWGSPELVELGLASLRGPRKGQARRALPRLRAHGATA